MEDEVNGALDDLRSAATAFAAMLDAPHDIDHLASVRRLVDETWNRYRDLVAG